MHSMLNGVCILVIFTGITIAVANYPSDLPKCRMGDNSCITEVVQLFARNYSDGIPSINLPSLDPLFVARMDLFREKKFSLLSIVPTMEYIDWKNSNVKLYGLKNATFTITGFEKNLNDSNVIITILLPNVTFTAEYDMNFKFLQRQTNGQGKLRCEFENWEFRWNFKLRLYEKDDGKQYMSIDQPNADYTFTAVTDLNFGTLFDGNELLSRLEHVFLNKNGKLLIDVIKPELGPEITKSYTDIIELIFSKFPIDQLFLIEE